MSKKLHDKLEKEARKKGLKGERKNSYIYRTMNKIEESKRKKKKWKKYFILS